MAFYLTMTGGKKFDNLDISKLQRPTIAMLSVTAPTNGERLYVMLAPSECYLRRKLQTSWGFELATPTTIRQIVHPSKILKPVQGEIEIDELRHIYLGQNIVGRLLADTGAKSNHYDRLRYLTEQFNVGIAKLAGVDFKIV